MFLPCHRAETVWLFGTEQPLIPHVIARSAEKILIW